MVIPKAHHRWVWDVPNIGEYYVVVAKIANGIKKAFGIDYVVSLVFGEEVPHAHVWLVPRFEDDGHGSSIDMKLVKKISAEDMAEAAKMISESIE